MTIEVRNITKHFGQFIALEDVTLSISPGELIVLLGPSGCGKTTLLRIIAGLENPDSGTILFQGKDMTAVPVRERNVGLVFQHYALFKHMTVFENVAFGLRMRPCKQRLAEVEIRERVNELLQLVQLDWLVDRYPQQLSGGQRQRIALARALAVKPNILLLDEPFGALDAKVRKELRQWIKHFHKELQITSVLVTHDQEEGLEVADRLVILNEGKIEQVGTPDEVYEHPATPFVYHFLGDVNLFHGRVHLGQAWIGKAEVNLDEPQGVNDASALIYVRPHDITVDPKPNGGDSIAATLRYIRPVGAIVHLELECLDDGEMVEAQISRQRYHQLVSQVGDRVFIRPQNPRMFVDACLEN
jgi:sulfate/thiosulfate transport system ATP-binding protein